ncbi:MAG: glycosyltransferase family 4 protein [Anaerolineae bacterium]
MSRILYLSTWCPDPPDNGSRIRAHYLLRALAAAHDVTALAFDPGTGTSSITTSAAGLEGVPLHRVAADPFRYTRLPQWAKFASPVPVSLWLVAEMRRAVRDVLASERFDAVVSLGGSTARYALECRDTALVLDIDTSLAYQMRERHLGQSHPISWVRTWTSWRKAERSEGALMRRFDACTVTASMEVDYLRRITRSDVTPIPNGVDCAHNHPGLAPKRPGALVYNGALTYSANYDAMRYFLGEIYPLIQRREPGASLTITGSTAGVDLSGLPIGESVQLSGYVEDIRPVVAGSSVCVVPLRAGGGTRLKILEAMALGTPVVSTSKGAEGLDLVDGEHILIADEPAQFAAKTLRLLQDAALRERLAASARRLVEARHDWRSIGQRFVQVVDAAIARKKGA